MIIKTIDDAGREIKRLSDQFDRLNSRNMDLNGRRIINAGNSQQLTDYITRGEVLDLLKQPETQQRINPGWLQIDATISDPEVGEDITPHPVPWIPLNEKGIPVIAGVRLRTAPTGGDFSIRWNHYSKRDDNTVDLFNGELLTVPEGELYATIGVFYPRRNIATQDYFKLDITEVNEAAGVYTFLALMVTV